MLFDRGRRRHLVSVNLLLASLIVAGGCNRGESRQLPPTAFHVIFENHNIPKEMKPGEHATAEVRFRNASSLAWPSKPNSKNKFAVSLSYHWLNPKGEMVVFEGARTALPNDVKPGDVVDLRQTIQAPDRPGTYVLEVTLVQEGNAWFPEVDSANKVAMPVIVTDGKTPPVQVAEVAKTPPSPEAKQVKSKSENLTAEEKKERKLRREKRREERAKAAKEKAAQEKGTAVSQKGAWAVQVGSFAKEKDAKVAADRLKDKGHDAYVVSSDVDGKRWYRVRVGHLVTKADAEALQKKLSTEKASQSMVVMNR